MSHAMPSLPNATIVHRQDIAPDAAIFRVAPVGWKLPVFEPGQFATLGLPVAVKDAPPADATESESLIRRAYSIASAPSQTKWLEFYIVCVEHGRFTSRLWRCGTGDQVWLDPVIRGHFTPQHIPAHVNLLLVATGTGVAPYMSMLREFHAERRWQRVALIHGVRLVEDLGYRGELEGIAARDESFAYIPTVTREPAESDWSGLRGRVQHLIHDTSTLQRLTGFVLEPAACHVMLCGNPAMIEDVQILLQNQGFVPSKHGRSGDLHFERYW